MSLLAGAYLGFTLLRSYDLTPRQLVVKAARKFGLYPQQAAEAVKLAPRYIPETLEGEPVSGHPRILFSGKEAISTLRTRYAGDVTYRKRVDGIASGSGILSGAVA